MHGLPVMLNLRGQRCLIVGGGSVAVRRARALIAAGCDQVVVVAPKVDDALKELPVKIEQRKVCETDLAQTLLVVLATDDAAVNDRTARMAASLGVLVNRADDAQASEVRFMATARQGPITLAIDTGSAMPDAARAIRAQVAMAIDEHWPPMLEIAGPCRQIIRQNFRDAALRQDRIARLTDANAIAIYKMHGVHAYRTHCAALCNSDSAINPGTGSDLP